MQIKKYGKYIISFFLCICFLICSIPAIAAENNSSISIIELENGDYIEIVTTILPVSNSRSSKDMTAAKRTFTYTGLAGDKIVSYAIYGEFEYDGTTSKATYVDYEIGLYRSGWDVDSHSEYISGNSVRGSATFNGPLNFTKTLSGGITCDKNGKII